jgi:hypothetical protein
MRLCLNGNQFWTAGFRAPGSTARIGFRSPPAFLPLSGGGGGGVRNRGRTSSTVTIGAPGSTTLKAIPDPPPAFLPLSRGGGGSGIRRASSQRPRSKRPDQRRSGDPILLSCSVLINVGPSPRLPCVPPSPLF